MKKFILFLIAVILIIHVLLVIAFIFYSFYLIISAITINRRISLEIRSDRPIAESLFNSSFGRSHVCVHDCVARPLDAHKLKDSSVSSALLQN